MVGVHRDAAVQGPAVRPGVPPHRPVRAHLPGVLGLRRERRAEAAAHTCLAVPGMRGMAGPGCERGGERRQGRRAGGDSLWSAGKTGTDPGAALRSRNPPEATPGRGVTDGNLRLQSGEEVNCPTRSRQAKALALLERGAAGRAERIAALRQDGYPAYSTAPGWLGYSDERLAALCAEAVAEGFTQVRIKVGAALDDDKRRCAIARDAVGDDIGIAIDANQVWDVPTAIAWISELAPFRPAWVEEPTAPEDILGTAAIRRGVRPVHVATGEHVANPVMFKQLLQAGAVDIMQIDACRVAGVNENLANLLLAAKFGVPVCPHAGGVGLCEIVQHLSMFDFVALSGTTAGRRIEWIDHLHEHFTAPARVVRGRYLAPTAPGASTEMHPESLAEYCYPSGPAWRDGAMP